MSELPPFGPHRDRRRHRRILTKRTVLGSLLVLAVLFIAISIWSEISDQARYGKGRLYSRRLTLPDLPPRKAYSVVTEDEIRPSAGADPLLLDYARREQILGVEPGMLERQYGIDPDAPVLGGVSESPLGGALGRAGSSSTAEVKITGGPEGVRIEKSDGERKKE